MEKKIPKAPSPPASGCLDVWCGKKELWAVIHCVHSYWGLFFLNAGQFFMTRRNVSSQAAKATGIYMIQRKQLFFFHRPGAEGTAPPNCEQGLL